MSDSKSSTSLVKHRDDKNASGSSHRRDDNDKYGGSRRDRGNRDRGDDEGRYQYSNASASGSRGGRFIPCTPNTLSRDFGSFLCEVFKVSGSKVADWCDEEYIRIDTTKDPRETAYIHNVDPLRQVVSKQDWEKWEKAWQSLHNEEAVYRYYISKGMNPTNSHYPKGDDDDEDDDDSE